METKVINRELSRIADLRKAQRTHECNECHRLIPKGSSYYSVVIPGGGLGSLKFPDRVHLDCLNAYFERIKRSRD